MSVNFTTVDTFKYWCNKILPLVYDDSLSYYEQLCKVVAVLNQVVENVNKLPEYIAEVVSDERLKEILTELLAEIKEQVASGNEGDSETATSDRVVGELVWLKGKLYRVIKQMDNGDRYVVDGNVEKVTVESVIDDLKGDVAEYVEVNQSIASKDIKEGELVWYKNELVKCIKDIAEGSGYVEGSNYEVVTVEKLLRDLGLRIDNEAEARKNADNTLQGGIYAEANNRESADNQLQSNINAEKADRQSADNQLQGNIDTEKADRQSADNQLQSNIDTEKADRLSADNQLQSNIDTEKADRQSADNQLIKMLGKIILIGDSYAGEEASVGSSWATIFNECTGANAIVSATGGAGFSVTEYPTFLSLLQRVVSGNQDAKTIVVLGGYNEQIHGGSVDKIDDAISEFMTYCKTNFPYATVYIGMVGGSGNPNYQLYTTFVSYRDSARKHGGVYLEGSQNIIKGRLNIKDDLTHPTVAGNTEIGTSLLSMIFSGYQPNKVGSSVVTPNSGVTLSASGFTVQEAHGMILTDVGVGERIGFTNGVQHTCAPTADYIEVGSQDCNYITSSLSPAYPTSRCDCIIQIGTNTFYHGTCIIWLNEGKLKIRPIAWSSEIADWVTGSVTAVLFTSYNQLWLPLDYFM